VKLLINNALSPVLATELSAARFDVRPWFSGGARSPAAPDRKPGCWRTCYAGPRRISTKAPAW